MKHSFRNICRGAMAAAVLLTLQTAVAQDYPAKQIICIVPTEAGGDGDLLVRALFEGVSARLGKPIVVVNKPGAAGSAGYREIHEARPDGYTIGLAFPTLYMNKMQGFLPWDHHDFTLIAQHGSFTPIMVTSTKSALPLKSLKEVIAQARAKPGEVKFALSVVGGSWWMAGLLLQSSTKTAFKNIPQEGSGAVVIAQLAGGHTDVGVSGLATAMSQIDAGNLNLIATFGRERIPGRFSNVPTVLESGFDVVWDSPNFLIGPPRMPKAVVEKLVKAMEVEANKPEYKKAVLTVNGTPFFQPSEPLLAYLEKQKEVSRDILQKNGVLKDSK